MCADYIIGFEPPPSPWFVPPVPLGFWVPLVGLVVLDEPDEPEEPEVPEVPDVPGSIDWTVPPKLLARSFTCSTTRLMTLRAAATGLAATGLAGGAGFFATTLRRAEGFDPLFLAAGRRADLAFELDFFDAFFEDFAEPLFLEAGAFFFEAFFEDGRRLLEAFFDDFLDEPFFALFFDVFFDDLREERFLDAAMLCLLLLLSVPGAGLDQGITLRGNLVARNQFRRTCCECHAR